MEARLYGVGRFWPLLLLFLAVLLAGMPGGFRETRQRG